MNWDDVRIFLAVARTGQILAAARRLGLNHATVSRRLTALEKNIRTRLVIRRTTGCELSEAGAAFLRSAERMETELLGAHSSLGMVDGTISGTVRIGAPDGFGVSYLAPRLGALSDRHPELTLQLVPVPRSFSLSQREADIAITVEPPVEGRLICRRLVDYTLGLYASRDYLRSHPAPTDFAALEDHRLVGYVDDLVFSPSLHFAAELEHHWNATIAISSATGQTEAVRSGAGIGILHDYIARPDPLLVPVMPEKKIRRTYWSVIHESARDLARIRTVSDYLKEIVARDNAIFI
ncbi:MAG: LysR family transcriptional regulator [Pararhizobium sp.]